MNKTVRDIFNWVALLLLVLGGFFFIRSHCHASTFESECMVFPEDEDYVDPMLDSWTKFRKHRDFAKEFFVLAEEMAWYLPDYDDKELAKLCFTCSLAMYAPVDIVSKIIATSLAIFSDYGLHTIDRWQGVKHCLHRAIYHADLMLFYHDLWEQESAYYGYVVTHNHVDEDGSIISND